MRMPLILIAIGGLAFASSADAKIKDWAVTPQSDKAVVLMRADVQPFNYAYWFSREGGGGFGRRVFSFEVKAFDRAPFTARTFEAGSYQLNSLVQQGAWSTCFGQATHAITVEAGKVYYLGTPNTLPLLADLQTSAQARGKTRLTRGALAIGWEPRVRPVFAPVSETELAEVRQFVRSAMPKTTAPVVPLATRPTSFTSTGSEKLIQICG